MIDEVKIESYKKFSYFCQSAYNSIQIYLELIKKRKIELANQMMFKVLDDIENMIKHYNNISRDFSKINILNSKFEFLFEGIKNMDYYLIRDVFEYEMLPILEDIFKDFKKDIYNVIS
ncbi:hypothetical protein Q428_05905 [Fervidicella metallireducens AeB]|uniref:Uncharacterized protein n=1 Tax=Fervidicella metallireducens AeB TaxID=1403537 RepID=A0A017RW25_9CLOT|nr:hypothetical protein [Fervidicella metallireducens]EYE88821.1 hypothetical protein Q428_05905 [Fervidicella metallireducens AeB]